MSHNFEELFGPVVGNGSQATVYAKGDYAVKLYREGYPKANVFSDGMLLGQLLEQYTSMIEQFIDAGKAME